MSPSLAWAKTVDNHDMAMPSYLSESYFLGGQAPTSDTTLPVVRTTMRTVFCIHPYHFHDSDEDQDDEHNAALVMVPSTTTSTSLAFADTTRQEDEQLWIGTYTTTTTTTMAAAQQVSTRHYKLVDTSISIVNQEIDDDEMKPFFSKHETCSTSGSNSEEDDNAESNMEATFPRRAPSKPTTRHKHVTFGVVCVHFHETILGDNPACSEGVPIAIGWREIDRLDLSVDDFERTRQPQKPKNGNRNNNNHLKIPPGRRVRILCQAGYKMSQILHHAETLQAERDFHVPFAAHRRSTAYPAPKICGVFAACFRTKN